jgi:sugar phosphate isomerase/epimerase
VKLGLFTALYGSLNFDELLHELQRYPAITAVELGTGNFPGASHVDVDTLLASSAAAATFGRRIADAGLTISALSCHGNPIHPRPGIASHDDDVIRRTILLAEKLGVPVVNTFSGCPGGAAADVTPNWITAAWPPEYAVALEWQWNERVIPYWKKTAAFAADHGVRIALEAHPGFVVYNPETLLRLRAAAGPSIGINFDPSHMWWQGIDIPTAIAELGDAIFHFHAKDVSISPGNRARNGVLDTKSYREMAARTWIFRSVGWGHSEIDWKGIASALRIAGYDYVISIEHEDALTSIHEGLSSAINMLSRILITEPAVEPWWT